MLDIAATCLVITALLAWLNQRFVWLPTTMGVMVIALGLSLAIVGLDALGWVRILRRYEQSLIGAIDFSDVLMQGMLSLLLFAGAMHVDLGALKDLALVIAGESLFNDGVGVGVFALLLGVLTSGSTPTAGEAAMLLLQEAGGGLAFGLALGLSMARVVRATLQGGH